MFHLSAIAQSKLASNLRQKIERLQNTRERERIETRLDEEKVNFRFSRKFQTVTLKAAASSFFRSKKAI